VPSREAHFEAVAEGAKGLEIDGALGRYISPTRVSPVEPSLDVFRLSLERNERRRHIFFSSSKIF
jgi:hypothetical protein